MQHEESSVRLEGSDPEARRGPPKQSETGPPEGGQDERHQREDRRRYEEEGHPGSGRYFARVGAVKSARRRWR
jgi:hypothetical protein